MLRRRFKKKSSCRRAQTLSEYTIIIGLIIMAFMAMQHRLIRAIQGMVRLVADQVGVQKNSDQRFDESGHMISSDVMIRQQISKETRDVLGVINYIYNDITAQNEESSMNLGYTENPPQ